MIPINEIFAVDWREVAALDCPVDLQGWNSDFPIFDQLVAAYKVKVAIEVGSWKGRSAIHIAKAMLAIAEKTEADTMKRVLYCVDTWQGGIDHLLSDLPQDDIKRELGYPMPLYRQFLHNCLIEGASEIIQPVPCPSVIGAKLLRAHGVRADLIYIDGDHTHDGCYADLCAYWELLKPGGVMFGDDVTMPGVHSAVARFMDSYGIATVDRDDPFWIISKLHSD